MNRVPPMMRIRIRQKYQYCVVNSADAVAFLPINDLADAAGTNYDALACPTQRDRRKFSFSTTVADGVALAAYV